MTEPAVKVERLWDSLMEMAKIGATPRGGNCRLALTEEDRQGRDLFCSWVRARARTALPSCKTRAAPNSPRRARGWLTGVDRDEAGCPAPAGPAPGREARAAATLPPGAGVRHVRDLVPYGCGST